MNDIILNRKKVTLEQFFSIEWTMGCMEEQDLQMAVIHNGLLIEEELEVIATKYANHYVERINVAPVGEIKIFDVFISKEEANE